MLFRWYRIQIRVQGRSPKPESVVQILNNLPKDKPVLIEVGNHFWIHKTDDFYNPFKQFLQSQTSNIYWIATGRVKKELITLGLKKEKIFKNRSEYERKKVTKY
jgi:hypothetical protein